MVGIVSQTDLVHALARRLPAQPAEAPTDQEIRNGVLEEFKRAAWLANCATEIVVHKRVVELHGVVKSDVIRDALLVAAENVEGVRRVENFIELAPSCPGDDVRGRCGLLNVNACITTNATVPQSIWLDKICEDRSN